MELLCCIELVNAIKGITIANAMSIPFFIETTHKNPTVFAAKRGDLRTKHSHFTKRFQRFFVEFGVLTEPFLP